MSEWKPIESAPQMQTILLFAVTDIDATGKARNHKTATGFWHSAFAHHPKKSPWNWDGEQLEKWETQPTHWMPLPAPPRQHAQSVDDGLDHD